MEIVAKTEDSFLINATKQEIQSILSAVIGQKPEEIKIGQRIPAIDYATTIRKIKELRDNYSFLRILEFSRSFIKEVEVLEKAVREANSIET